MDRFVKRGDRSRNVSGDSAASGFMASTPSVSSLRDCSQSEMSVSDCFKTVMFDIGRYCTANFSNADNVLSISITITQQHCNADRSNEIEIGIALTVMHS